MLSADQSLRLSCTQSCWRHRLSCCWAACIGRAACIGGCAARSCGAVPAESARQTVPRRRRAGGSDAGLRLVAARPGTEAAARNQLPTDRMKNWIANFSLRKIEACRHPHFRGNDHARFRYRHVTRLCSVQEKNIGAPFGSKKKTAALASFSPRDATSRGERDRSSLCTMCLL